MSNIAEQQSWKKKKKKTRLTQRGSERPSAQGLLAAITETSWMPLC